MLCAVYKSSKKQQTFLYIKQRDNFDDVPSVLLKHFGKPEFLMLIPFNKVRKIGLIDSSELQKELSEKGFYLQIPPPEPNLLDMHRQSMGLSPYENNK